MTMMRISQGNEAPAEDSYYTIAPQAIEASGRSLSVILGDRLCEAARTRLKSPDAWRTMSYKELRKLLRDNCADQDGYLSAQQPVLETAFRMLLTAPSGKLSLSEMHSQLAELWMTSPWPRHIGAESLKRLLDNGVSYGIVRAEGE